MTEQTITKTQTVEGVVEAILAAERAHDGHLVLDVNGEIKGGSAIYSWCEIDVILCPPENLGDLLAMVAAQDIETVAEDLVEIAAARRWKL